MKAININEQRLSNLVLHGFTFITSKKDAIIFEEKMLNYMQLVCVSTCHYSISKVANKIYKLKMIKPAKVKVDPFYVRHVCR